MTIDRYAKGNEDFVPVANWIHAPFSPTASMRWSMSSTIR
jgi:hypothetical protein